MIQAKFTREGMEIIRILPEFKSESCPAELNQEIELESGINALEELKGGN